ncbi:MAG TPA: hypothetical protein VEB21_17900, partial [Terriglobales bacterium]|nr:hypothetical protein [Terriglobales bacterium]
VFGGCAAHLINDADCRRWTEADAPALVSHTHGLLEPFELAAGEWIGGREIPASLIDVLAECGRQYLPWVSEATVDGEAEVVFGDGVRVRIAANDFLRQSRATMLARYRALRSDNLDQVLERAGVLHYFADHLDQAGAVPQWDAPPQPKHNRPYPPEGEH